MIGHALLLRDGRVLAGGRADEVLTSAGMTACFGRPIEVSRHEGRWLARSGTASQVSPVAGSFS